MIDREQVAEALALLNDETYMVLASASEPIRIAIEAAQAWLDQGNALVIRRDENGMLPSSVQGALGKALIDYADDPEGWDRIDSHISNLLAALSDRSDNG